jgi:predicted dehydrogenase
VRRVATPPKRRDEYPDAKVFTDHASVEARRRQSSTSQRTPKFARRSLRTVWGEKAVLSQKPFVLDLDEGERLAALAEKKGVLLAVNQNARWAPHFSYIREAVKAGLIGEVASVHCGVHWDHSWVRGTAFERVYHLILYDFAIHWFDLLATLMGEQRATRVFASTVKSPSQDIMPALLGQAAIEYASTQATLVFDGHAQHGPQDDVYVAGTLGTLRSYGPSVNRQTVELIREGGAYQPTLVGSWFPDGFHGTMGELLCAIEERREPTHSARANLRSRGFAAVASGWHEPVEPGRVATDPRQLREAGVKRAYLVRCCGRARRHRRREYG